MSIETIIAEAIADGGSAVGEALVVARRVVAALQAASVLAEDLETYEPQEYPKWVGTRIVHTKEQEAALTPAVASEEAVPAEEEAKPVTIEPEPVMHLVRMSEDHLSVEVSAGSSHEAALAKPLPGDPHADANAGEPAPPPHEPPHEKPATP